MTIQMTMKQDKRNWRELFLLPEIHFYNEFEEEVYPIHLSKREIEGLHNLLNPEVEKNKKEKTMRKRDEVEDELNQVEFYLRNAAEKQQIIARWEGYRDALKWVLLYPSKFK